MLKIKDSVGLKELEKFGLIKEDKFYNEKFKKIELDGESQQGWINICGFKIWKENFWSVCFELETLYDLIQADLVEKV